MDSTASLHFDGDDLSVYNCFYKYEVRKKILDVKLFSNIIVANFAGSIVEFLEQKNSSFDNFYPFWRKCPFISYCSYNTVFIVC